MGKKKRKSRRYLSQRVRAHTRLHKGKVVKVKSYDRDTPVTWDTTKRAEKRRKARESLFYEPKESKYAKIIRIDSPWDAKQSIHRLEKEYESAQTEAKKKRVLRAMDLASKRAAASAKRKDISEKERKEMLKVAALYRASYAKYKGRRDEMAGQKVVGTTPSGTAHITMRESGDSFVFRKVPKDGDEGEDIGTLKVKHWAGGDNERVYLSYRHETGRKKTVDLGFISIKEHGKGSTPEDDSLSFYSFPSHIASYIENNRDWIIRKVKKTGGGPRRVDKKDTSTATDSEKVFTKAWKEVSRDFVEDSSTRASIAATKKSLKERVDGHFKTASEKGWTVRTDLGSTRFKKIRALPADFESVIVASVTDRSREAPDGSMTTDIHLLYLNRRGTWSSTTVYGVEG